MTLSGAIIPLLGKVSGTLLLSVFKSFKNKTREKTLEREVERFLPEFEGGPLENSSFINFIQLPSTERTIIDYVKFCAFRVNDEKKQFKGALDKNSFVSLLSARAVAYVKEDKRDNLPEKIVNDYFFEIVSVLEKKLIKLLDIEKIGLLYFLNNSLLEMEQRIMEIQNYNFEKADHNFEKVYEDYIKLIKRRSQISHVYGIDDIDLYSFYVFPKFFINQNLHENELIEEEEDTIEIILDDFQPENIIEWNKIFKESNRISLIGGAGFGKSLFLKNVINKFSYLDVYDCDKLLPIYCDLKQFKINSAKKTNYSIKEFLIDSMISMTGLDEMELSKGFIEHFLNAGKCLILFDALDEVQVQDRNEVNELIGNFFELTNKYNKIIITSRAQGFIPRTRIVYEVCPVDENQIREYLNNMVKIKQFKQENIKEFMEQCVVLIKNGFLTSLLTVSLLVQIYKAEKELPENKIELYDKCVEYISKKREKDQKKSNFDFKLMSNILDNNVSFEKLSWLAKPNNIEIEEIKIKEYFIDFYQDSYASKNETRNAIDEFLNFCSQRTELYVAGNQEMHYKFYHRSFFEFFYSKHLINEKKKNESLFSELMKFGLDSEIFELTIALLKKYNYERFKSFTQLLLEKVNVLNQGNIADKGDHLSKICMMLLKSGQLQHLVIVYNKLINEEKLLSLLGNRKSGYGMRYIADLLVETSKRIPDEKNVEKDILNFYKEEVDSCGIIRFLLTNNERSVVYYNEKFSVYLNFRYISMIINIDKRKKSLARLDKEYLFNFIDSAISIDESETKHFDKKSYVNNLVESFKKELQNKGNYYSF